MKSFLIAILFIVSVSLNAQSFLSVNIGANKGYTDVDTKIGSSVHLDFRQSVHRYLSLTTDISYNHIDGGHFSTNDYQISVGGLTTVYEFNFEESVIYLITSGSFNLLRNSRLNEYKQSITNKKDNCFGLVFGIGGKIYINNGYSINIESRYNYLFSDYLDAINPVLGSKYNDIYLELSIGLEIPL